MSSQTSTRIDSKRPTWKANYTEWLLEDRDYWKARALDAEKRIAEGLRALSVMK